MLMSSGHLMVHLATVLALSGVSDVQTRPPDPERGLQLLLNKPFNPSLFDQQTFDELWKCWPESLRAEAARASADQRRELAFERYGLTRRPGDGSGKPLQFVVDNRGRWSMNCFSCHTGKVGGQVYYGVPNANFAFETLLEDVVITSLRLHKPLPAKNYSGRLIPHGSSDGVTNAFMLAMAFLAERDSDLNLKPRPSAIELNHHSLDAPAWWRIQKRQRFYCDGFARKNHRALMLLLLDSRHGLEYFQQNEDDFKDILAWLESLEPPKYPYAINRTLAKQGQTVFESHCAKCHGTYGSKGNYPEKIVPISVVGTDPVRLRGVTRKHRQLYERSWLADYGKHKVTQPDGYLAPPLDGIWATAPYFHNGSVPTLWHVMHPDERPVIWRRVSGDYDEQHIGLQIQSLESVPEDIRHNSKRRKYYDTRVPGKNAAGHTFPDTLTEEEKTAVLEYLKTL